MTRRSRAREVAFQVLYQDDLNPRHNPAETDQLIERRLRAGDLVEFARQLVSGVRQNRESIDNQIQQSAANWSLKRMAATDRNVLRLAFSSCSLATRPAAWPSTRPWNWPSDSARPSRRRLSTESSTELCTQTTRIRRMSNVEIQMTKEIRNPNEFLLLKVVFGAAVSESYLRL